MKAIILAAGYATRLWPLTENLPKPLLCIGDRPIINYLVEKMDNISLVDGVFVVTNDRFFPYFENWKRKYNFNHVTIVNDLTTSNTDRLEILGDLMFVLDKFRIDDDILLLAGDNYFEDDLLQVVDLWKDKKTSTLAMYDIKDLHRAKFFGVGSVDENGKVTEFVEKPEYPNSTLIGTLIYLIDKIDIRVIDTHVKEASGPNELRGGDLINRLLTDSTVHATIFQKPWFDVGTLDQLNSCHGYVCEQQGTQISFIS